MLQPISRSLPRRCAWPSRAVGSKRCVPCRTDHGCSAAPFLMAQPQKPSLIARASGPGTPQDQFPINELFSLQQHSEMGVMERNCSTWSPSSARSRYAGAHEGEGSGHGAGRTSPMERALAPRPSSPWSWARDRGGTVQKLSMRSAGAADRARPSSSPSQDGILVVSAADEADPVQQTPRAPAQDLERLGLAKERQQGARPRRRQPKASCGSWRTGRQFQMTHARSRKRASTALPPARRCPARPRKALLIGKVVGVGLVDEITTELGGRRCRRRARHYAEAWPARCSARHRPGHAGALGDSLQVKPSVHPRVQVLAGRAGRRATYDGPTGSTRRSLQVAPDGSAGIRGRGGQRHRRARPLAVTRRELRAGGAAASSETRHDAPASADRDGTPGRRTFGASQRVRLPVEPGRPDRGCL